MRYLILIAAALALTACETPMNAGQKDAYAKTQVYLEQEVAAGHISRAQADAYLAQMKAQYQSQNDANAMAGYAALGSMQTGYRSTYATFTGK